MPNLVTLPQLRDLLQACVDDLSAWCVAKPRLFDLPRPEQQIQFELACRVREELRQRSGNARWDRLYFDASDAPLPAAAAARPPIFIDTRQLFGTVASGSRSPSEPDVALAVHVLRSSKQNLELDDNGTPVQGYAPRSLLDAGAALEERVAQFERLSRACCDAALLVIYSNEARRRTAVDTREIASWASWQTPLDTLWWTARYFRARAR